ncbi:MAG: hypothetical protein ACTSQC_02440 [Candidatus Heimdallarchaeaceae archaeon]
MTEKTIFDTLSHAELIDLKTNNTHSKPIVNTISEFIQKSET